MKAVAGWLRRIQAAAAWAAACCLALLLLLVLFNVIMREFSVPIGGFGMEYSGYLMAAIVTLSLGFVALRGGHLKVTLIDERLSERKRTMLNIAQLAIALVVTVFVTVHFFGLVVNSYRTGTVSVGAFPIPVFWPQILLPLGTALLALQVMVKLGTSVLFVLGQERKK